jgi:predicted RNA binding protein YcfA (HicA-like mRNA interferase family)
MSKLPRDVSGDDLVGALTRFGYVTVRQTGSHIRMTTRAGGENHVTVPKHRAIKPGTLGAILDNVASHAGITRDELLQRLAL